MGNNKDKCGFKSDRFYDNQKINNNNNLEQKIQFNQKILESGGKEVSQYKTIIVMMKAKVSYKSN